MAEVRTYDPPPCDGPKGIGGWLILPILGMFLTPLYQLFQLSQYLGIVDDFSFLTPGQQVFVILEIAGYFAIGVIFPIVALVLFFNKRRSFPRFYVVWAMVNLVFIVGDLLAAKILFGHLFEASGTPLIDAETLQAIIRAILLMVIWVPYMLTSRRVRNTFVQ